MDNLQESIDSLVRSMGLDLPNGGSSVGVDVGDGAGVGTETGEGDGEFNVDEFLQGLAKEGEEEGEREVEGDGGVSSSGAGAGAENGRKEDVIAQSGLKSES